MLRKISLAFLSIFISLLSYSQKKESITVKKIGGIDFFRIGEFNDSIVVKNVSDMFYCQINSDTIEVKFHNATLLKTNEQKKFKLVYAPGMKYRMIQISDHADKLNTIEKSYEVKIQPDGVATTNKKDIFIELWDTKANHIVRAFIFTYKEK